MRYDPALWVVLVPELVGGIEEAAVDKRWDPHRTTIAAMSNLAWLSNRANPPVVGKQAVLEHPHFAAESSM